MTQPEYEQKKRECWDFYIAKHGLEYAIPEEAFAYAFDRAYALGKQTETITQEEIEKAAEKHADELTVPPSLVGALVPLLHDVAKSSYQHGAQDFIGKQEKDADAVIQGWVAVDKDNLPRLHYTKPSRTNGNYWQGAFKSTYFPKGLFPDLTWESKPEQIEIIIKRKKNG